MNSKKLYHFLMNNECHLFNRGNDVIAWSPIYFYDIREFVEMVGKEFFEDSGHEVSLHSNYIAIELNDIIENNGEDLSDYKECFGNEWEEYFEEE